MRTLISLIFSSLLLSGCGTTSFSTLKLNTPSQYSTDGRFYDVKKNKKEVGIVFLHGKRGDPDTSHNSDFISKMTDLGYPVVAPIMPWSEMRGYTGSRQQGMNIITAAVNALDTHKVIVIGHSMGGMAVLQYGARGVPSKVVGLISVAPGHDPNNAMKLQSHTGADAYKACQMLASGKGNERSNFADMNGGRTYTIYASAEYYCTHFSLTQYPDSQQIAEKIKSPIFILSGEDDRLTYIYSHEVIYNSLPKNNKNKHAILTGDHLNVLYKHTDAISKWIDSL
jgi:pimeloyl-ACP methyl ester carboxylesterase